MAEPIPQLALDDLLSRIDIVDIVDEYVHLKKMGRSYKACCPFHEEKTPSFNVNQTKQFFYCFGCQQGGNAINFLMAYKNITFIEAVKLLAVRVGIDINFNSSARDAKREQITRSIYDILELAKQFYIKQLQHNSVAQNYFVQRGLSAEIITRYELGFAPDGWDNLGVALRKQGVSEDALLATGMLSESENNKRYDRFRNRVMFPIRDQRGKVIAFGGRVFAGGEPKYLNSPETAVFHKSHALYGLYELLQKIRDPKQIIVVEGYMDVLMLAAHHINCAVATLGTATTESHLKSLYRFAPEIIFCFDGDSAGKKAAWRALEVALTVVSDGHVAKFLFLPENEDPDSYVQKFGAKDFLNLATHAHSLSEFFFDNLMLQTDMTTVDGRARLVSLATPHLKTIQDEVFKQMMFAELAQRTRTQMMQFSDAGSGTHKKNNRYALNQAAHKAVVLPSAMRTAIALVIQHPSLAQSRPGELPEIAQAGGDLLRRLLELARERKDLTTAILLEYFRDDELSYQHLVKLAGMELMLDEAGAAREFVDVVRHMQKLECNQLIEILMAKAAAKTLLAEEREKLKALLAQNSS